MLVLGPMAMDMGRSVGRKRRRRVSGGRDQRRRVAPRRQRRRNARTAGFLGIEKKFYDTSLQGASIGAAGGLNAGEYNPSATICLNSVTQGDGESQRDGRKIVMKYISVSGKVDYALGSNQTSLDTFPTIKIYLVLDQQTNGALLNSEDVFINPSAHASLSASSFRNLQYIQRFKVLKTVTISTRPRMAVYDGTNIEEAGHGYPFTMNVPLNDIPVNYSGTTETIANIVDNSLSIVAFATATSAGNVLSYNARLRFVG